MISLRGIIRKYIYVPAEEEVIYIIRSNKRKELKGHKFDEYHKYHKVEGYYCKVRIIYSKENELGEYDGYWLYCEKPDWYFIDKDEAMVRAI